MLEHSSPNTFKNMIMIIQQLFVLDNRILKKDWCIRLCLFIFAEFLAMWPQCNCSRLNWTPKRLAKLTGMTMLVLVIVSECSIHTISTLQERFFCCYYSYMLLLISIGLKCFVLRSFTCWKMLQNIRAVVYILIYF